MGRVLQGAALLAVLWSSWAVYSWLTNAVPAEDVIPARIVIFCSMGAMFVASLAVPGAFGDYGVLFAVAYLTVLRRSSHWRCLSLPSSPGRPGDIARSLAAFETVSSREFRRALRGR